MLLNYASEINSGSEASILITPEEDWPTLVNTLKSEKLKLTQSLNTLLSEKESLALSLENNHENKIERILTLEDKVSELLKQKSECTQEIQDLKRKLSAFQTENSSVPCKPTESQEQMQSQEDAYRQTIAEADSMLSKLEADYQSTIK